MEQILINTYQAIALLEQYFSYQKAMLYQHFWKIVTVVLIK